MSCSVGSAQCVFGDSKRLTPSFDVLNRSFLLLHVHFDSLRFFVFFQPHSGPDLGPFWGPQRVEKRLFKAHFLWCCLHHWFCLFILRNSGPKTRTLRCAGVSFRSLFSVDMGSQHHLGTPHDDIRA